MTYNIEILRSAQKQLQAVDKENRERIIAARQQKINGSGRLANPDWFLPCHI